MFKSKRLSIILAIGIFIIGLGCGILIHRTILFHKIFPFSIRPSQKQEERILNHMIKKFNKRLKLNEEQKNKLYPILKKHKQEMEVLTKEIRPKFEALRNQINEEIMTLLDEKQKIIFEKIQKEKNMKQFEMGKSRHWLK